MSRITNDEGFRSALANEIAFERSAAARRRGWLESPFGFAPLGIPGAVAEKGETPPRQRSASGGFGSKPKVPFQ